MDPLCQGACLSIGDILNHSASWNNPLTLTFILGVNVPLPQETFKVGFKAKSASRGFIQKQETMFGNLSFYRAGLTKALMLVYWREMLSVRSWIPFDFDLFWIPFDFDLIWIPFFQVGFGFQELQLSFFCGSNR